jgi:hypothetical protein
MFLFPATFTFNQHALAGCLKMRLKLNMQFEWLKLSDKSPILEKFYYSNFYAQA